MLYACVCECVYIYYVHFVYMDVYNVHVWNEMKYNRSKCTNERHFRSFISIKILSLVFYILGTLRYDSNQIPFVFFSTGF